MSEHTKTDGLPDVMPGAILEPVVLDKSRPRSERMASDKIECNACPVLCQISPGITSGRPSVLVCSLMVAGPGSFM